MVTVFSFLNIQAKTVIFCLVPLAIIGGFWNFSFQLSNPHYILSLTILKYSAIPCFFICALPRQNKNFIFLRSKIWETDYDFKIPTNKVAKNDTIPPNSYSDNCQNVKRNDGGLPLQSDYLAQIFHQIGAEFS